MILQAQKGYFFIQIVKLNFCINIKFISDFQEAPGTSATTAICRTGVNIEYDWNELIKARTELMNITNKMGYEFGGKACQIALLAVLKVGGAFCLEEALNYLLNDQ